MHIPRPAKSLVSVAAIGFFVAALGVFDALNPVTTRDVQAQTESATAPLETPPTAPGTGAAIAPAGEIAATDSALVAATPAIPVDATSDPSLTNDDGAYSTNLGGSDVAVASVGGSYEVDGPKRRSKRVPGRADRP